MLIVTYIINRSALYRRRTGKEHERTGQRGALLLIITEVAVTSSCHGLAVFHAGGATRLALRAGEAHTRPSRAHWCRPPRKRADAPPSAGTPRPKDLQGPPHRACPRGNPTQPKPRQSRTGSRADPSTARAESSWRPIPCRRGRRGRRTHLRARSGGSRCLLTAIGISGCVAASRSRFER